MSDSYKPVMSPTPMAPWLKWSLLFWLGMAGFALIIVVVQHQLGSVPKWALVMFMLSSVAGLIFSLAASQRVCPFCEKRVERRFSRNGGSALVCEPCQVKWPLDTHCSDSLD